MKKDRSEADWVEVAALGQDEQAELVAGRLESEGIPVVVEGPSHTPLPENLGAFGLSRVLVPPDRAEEARRVIAELERDSTSAADLDAEDAEE